MRQKMKNAPVYYVIVQARFNPILNLDSYVPQIQDKLRKNGFPDAQKNIQATVDVKLSPVGEGVPSQPSVVQTTRYTCCNINRTAGFILDQSALSYHTTEYDVFETFSAEFVKGLQAVHDVVELSYIDRTGLRYLDAVYPKGDDSVTDYLDQAVLGLPVEGRIIRSFSETQFNNQDTNLIVRVMVQDGPVGFPPDLLAGTLNVATRFQNEEGRHAILDIDGSYNTRESFDTGDIESRLDTIHEAVKSVFGTTITDHAKKIWG